MHHGGNTLYILGTWSPPTNIANNSKSENFLDKNVFGTRERCNSLPTLLNNDTKKVQPELLRYINRSKKRKLSKNKPFFHNALSYILCRNLVVCLTWTFKTNNTNTKKIIEHNNTKKWMSSNLWTYWHSNYWWNIEYAS